MDSIHTALARQAGLHLHALKYNVMPLRKQSKKPKFTSWKVRQETRLTRLELAKSITNDANIAVICGELEETGVNVVGIDFDDPKEFEEWEPKSNTIWKTSRGFVALYQVALGERFTNSIGLNRKKVDVRHHGSYVVAPPSVHPSGLHYEYVKGPVAADKLISLPGELLQNNVKPIDIPDMIKGNVNDSRVIMRGLIRNPEQYCLRVESREGHRGSAGLCRAAAILRDSGWTKEDAIDFLWNVWNRRADLVVPPWSLEEITRACSRIFNK